MEPSSGEPSFLAPAWTHDGDGDPPPHRRVDDHANPLRVHAVVSPADGGLARSDELAGATFILRLNADDVLVMQADDAHVLGAGAGDVERRIRAAAPAWSHERALRERRMRMAAWLMVYVDALDGAETRREVVEALCTCAPRVAGGLVARVCETDGSRVIGKPAVLTPSELRPDGAGGAATTALAALFQATCAAQLLCCPVSTDTVLVLVERRHDRIFTAEDRDVLEWIVKQAGRALRRLDADP